jgi:hypothetical protein
MPNTSSCISGTVLGAPRMIWGRLEDRDDGVTATRSEPRATRRTLYFGATQAGSLLASTTAE